jgi:hypothetical protein
LGLLDARGLAVPDSDGARRAARAMAGELGWDEARVEQELRDWVELARLEALVPDGVPVPAGEPKQEARLGAGAAPEEAA